MTRYLVVTAAMCGYVVLFSTGRLAADAPLATLAAGELRDALKQSQEKVQSLYVIYESDDYDDDTLPKGYMLHRVVACRAPDQLFHWTSHGHASLPWRDDSGQQIARIKNGVVRNEYPINRSFYESSLDLVKDGLPGTLRNEFLFGGVGFWYLPGIKPPRLNDVEPFVLSEIAASVSYDTVRPELELVDGRWCHVLERVAKDALWLDVDHGCALLAREAVDPASGYLGQRLELGGHSEIVNGIWFPKWIRNIRYDSGASTSDKRARIWKDATHDILEVRINEIDDTIFDWEPPAGALRVFDGVPSIQVSAGGIEHLDNVAGWIRRTNDIVTAGAPPNHQWSLYFGVVIVTIVCVECVFWSWRRKTRA